MELGNLCFGNSRGDYPVPREWEDTLYQLLETLAEFTNDAAGVTFENDVFWVTPYWWDGCTCGWEEVDNSHRRLRDLRHGSECYIHEYDEAHHLSGTNYNEFLRRLKPIYKKYGWPTDGETWWHGCAICCTCDYHERCDTILDEYEREFGYRGCKPDCMLVRDNFHYKPTGFGIQWYKYPLRDSYMSHDISLDDFKAIVIHCLVSLAVQEF